VNRLISCVRYEHIITISLLAEFCMYTDDISYPTKVYITELSDSLSIGLWQWFVYSFIHLKTEVEPTHETWVANIECTSGNGQHNIHIN
jgi:hypothetical protein